MSQQRSRTVRDRIAAAAGPVTLGLATTCVVCLTGLGLAASPAFSAVRTVRTVRTVRATQSIGNPVAGSNGFGIVTEGDALLGSTESEGPAAIGGNLSFGAGYNVATHTPGTFTAPGDSNPTALLVGGRIDYTDSSPAGVLKVLQNGYLKVGDMTGSQALDQDSNGASVNTHVVPSTGTYDATPRIELTTQQPTDSVAATGLMDFTSLFSSYRDRAQSIADCADNVTLLDSGGNAVTDVAPGSNVSVALTSGQTNVLHLTGEQLNNIGTMTFTTPPSASTPLVVVVDTSAEGGNLSWHTPNLAGVSGANAPYMLWDFPDATDITITGGDSLEGTIYAPSAHLTDLDPSNLEGDVIVKSLTAGPLAGSADASGSDVNAGEINYFPFDADLTCTTHGNEPSPTPTPTPTPTPPPTPTGPSATPTSPASAASAAPTAPGAGPTGPQLAKTGADPSTATLAAIAGFGLLSGAGATFWATRRRGSHR
jgi:choice-of-anchor A domain-containing protein